MAHRWSRPDMEAEVRRDMPAAFDFLRAEFGFDRPREFGAGEAFGVRYPGRVIDVEIACSERERQLCTQLERRLGSGCAAGLLLVEAYVALGIGPSQRVASSARTAHEIRKAIGSQALALGAVLRSLAGVTEIVGLFQAYGRIYPVDDSRPHEGG